MLILTLSEISYILTLLSNTRPQPPSFRLFITNHVPAFKPPSSSLLPRQSNKIQQRILGLLTLGNDQPHHNSKHRIHTRHHRRGCIEHPPAVILVPLKLARGVGRAHLLFRNYGDTDVGCGVVVDAAII
jgi:hypothetical protein